MLDRQSVTHNMVTESKKRWCDVNDLLQKRPVPYRAISNMFRDESLVKDIVDASDSRTLRELVREGSIHAWRLINILISHGESKVALLKACAFYGHDIFLEKACENDWHDYNGSWDDIVTSAAEGGKVSILKWLEMDLGYMDDRHVLPSVSETYDLAISWSITNDDVAVFGFLMSSMRHTTTALELCYEAVMEWAPSILDYLCEKVGRRVVEEEVHNLIGSEEFEFDEAALQWLEDAKDTECSIAVKEAMSIIDDVKDRIPEGHYLKISDLLLSVYKKV